MKVIFCCLLLFPFTLLARQKAQTVLRQSVTDSVTLDHLLDVIHQSGHIQLSYDPEIIPQVKILIGEGDYAAIDLLTYISAKTSLNYKKVGNNFILAFDANRKVLLSGIVTDLKTSEHLIGASIIIIGASQGVITNQYGYFALEVPISFDSIEFSYIGYETKRLKVPSQDEQVNIKIREKDAILGEVIITPSEDDELNIPRNDHIQLKSSDFNSVGGSLGERDLLRQLHLNSGVALTSESSTGFSVRGGRPNQNLILLDEAILYNPTHLAGIFSVFNVDALNKVDFYKGGIPAKFGGRLSSVTNVAMKEGSDQKFGGSGHFNLLAGSLTLEGPLKKDQGSFILSGRRSYPGVDIGDTQVSPFFFYDLNVKLNYKIGTRDRIYLSSYIGDDNFNTLNERYKFIWGNRTLTARWNHLFNDKLFLNTSLLFSNYDYELSASSSDQKLNLFAQLKSQTLKSDFNYFHNNYTQYNFGFSSTLHSINSAILSFDELENRSGFDFNEPNNSKGLENVLYAELEKRIGSRLGLIAGMRLSTFHNLGPGIQYIYDENFDTVGNIERGSGEVYHTHFNVEPRFSANFQINELHTLNASYNRNVQYVSQASNSLSGTPLDVWFLSSPNVDPQISDLITIGLTKNQVTSRLKFQTDIFYRKTKNEIDFKDHADLLLNNQLEGELRTGKASAYGIEFTLLKNKGKLTGNANLTLSKSFLDIPLVNNGLRYSSTYDRPINLSISSVYELNKRKHFQFNWAFFNGLPFTAPTGRFTFGNLIAPSFSERNGKRLPNYHRLDVAYEIIGKNKKKRRFHGSWSFSVYNVYNRKNANIISFRTVEGSNRSEAVKHTIIGLIPSIAYRFKF